MTGSSSGICRAIAGRLAAGGARVVVNSRDDGRAKEAADEIVAAGHEAVGVAADVSRPEGGQILVDAALAAYGRLDVLVNNACIPLVRAAEEITPEEWATVLATNRPGRSTAPRPRHGSCCRPAAGRSSTSRRCWGRPRSPAAPATPPPSTAWTGLPVLRDAGRRSVPGLAREIARLGAGARERSLPLQDTTGGTFTISNFGSYGTWLGTPLINAPQVAIAGFGRVHDAVVPVDGVPAVRRVLPLAVAADHRLIDGEHLGALVNTLERLIRTPLLLLGEED